MDENDRRLVRHEHISIPQPSELKICLNRGQKGSYGWDIQYSSQDRKKILETIEKVDTELRQKYVQNDAEKE